MSTSVGWIQPLMEIRRNSAQATVPLRDRARGRPDVKHWRTVRARYAKY